MEELIDHHHRRRYRDGQIPWAALAERIILWGSVIGLVATGAVKFVRLSDTVTKAEDLDHRMVVVEREQAARAVESNSRWDEILRRLDRIERKVDRRGDRYPVP